jgi:predicted transposase YbfD/YdcC
VPELLKILDLKGALVTLDAAGCQVEFARTIRKKEGDYLLCVKGNQEGLEAAVHEVVARAVGADFVGVEHDGHEEVTPRRRHGRREERYTTVIYDPAGLPAEWPDVAAVVMVNREREVKGERAETSHYFITSHRGTAAVLAGLIRRHWGVENELHWSLDVTFGEDRNGTSKGHAGTNLSLVRKVALSLLRQDPGKGSLNWKRLNAALDEG